MDHRTILFELEHDFLLKFFYELKEKFIEVFLRSERYLYDAFCWMCEEDKIHNPYKKEEFNVVIHKLSDEVCALEFTFPEPERTRFCYRAYMFYDMNFERLDYFCIEKGYELGITEPLLCGFSPDHFHFRYRYGTLDTIESLKQCYEIFLRNWY